MWQWAREPSGAGCPKSTSVQKGSAPSGFTCGARHLRSISICCSTSAWKQKCRKCLELCSSQRPEALSSGRAAQWGCVAMWGHSLGWTLRFLLPRVRAPCSASSGGNHSRGCWAIPEALCAGETLRFAFVSHIQPWGPSELLATVHPTQVKHAWCCQTAEMSKLKLVREVV